MVKDFISPNTLDWLRKNNCSVCHQIDIVHEGIVTFYSTLPSGESDLLDITDYLLVMEKANIYNLGLVLGIRQTKLKTLRDSETFLDHVIYTWLCKEDQVTEKGEPSWTVLVNALKHHRVGQMGIADIIAKDKGWCDKVLINHITRLSMCYYMNRSGIVAQRMDVWSKGQTWGSTLTQALFPDLQFWSFAG